MTSNCSKCNKPMINIEFNDSRFISLVCSECNNGEVQVCFVKLKPPINIEDYREKFNGN